MLCPPMSRRTSIGSSCPSRTHSAGSSLRTMPFRARNNALLPTSDGPVTTVSPLISTSNVDHDCRFLPERRTQTNTKDKGFGGEPICSEGTSTEAQPYSQAAPVRHEPAYQGEEASRDGYEDEKDGEETDHYILCDATHAC